MEGMGRGGEGKGKGRGRKGKGCHATEPTFTKPTVT